VDRALRRLRLEIRRGVSDRQFHSYLPFWTTLTARVEGVATAPHSRKTSVSPAPFRFFARRQECMLPGMSPDQRSRLFGEVNDRIYDLLESAEPDLPGEFLCECGRDCGRRVELLPAAFTTLRATGGLVQSPD